MTVDAWHCTGKLSEPQDLQGLDQLGGVPWEDEREDGLEAPLRPSLRTLAHGHGERDEASLPDLDDLWEHELRKDQQLLREFQAKRREAEREEENRIARIKAAARTRRRASELAAWRAEMHRKYPADPRWAPTREDS